MILAAALLFAAESKAGIWDTEQVRRVGARFADCVVKRRTSEARVFVLNDPRIDWEKDKAQVRMFRKLVDGDCLVKASKAEGMVMMRFPGDTMRYVMADALFELELANLPPLNNLDSVPLLPHAAFDTSEFEPKPGKKLKSTEVADLAKRRDVELSRTAFSKFGECVVRIDSTNSHKLLQAKPLTPEENLAFAALKDALGQCISKDTTVTLNKITVRGTIAYNYYRLAHAPRDAARKEAVN